MPYLFDQVVDFSIMDNIDYQILVSYAKSLNVSENKDIFGIVVMALINFAIINGNLGIIKLDGVLYNQTKNETFKFVSLKDYIGCLVERNKCKHQPKLLENCDAIIKNIFQWHSDKKCNIEAEDLLYAVKEVKRFRESIA